MRLLSLKIAQKEPNFSRAKSLFINFLLPLISGLLPSKMDPIRQYELPEIDRKLLAKNVPLKVLDRHIDFVVADEQDRSVIERFLNEDFVEWVWLILEWG